MCSPSEDSSANGLIMKCRESFLAEEFPTIKVFELNYERLFFVDSVADFFDGDFLLKKDSKIVFFLAFNFSSTRFFFYESVIFLIIFLRLS